MEKKMGDLEIENEDGPVRKSLVFVVGAGASHEVGLPLGAELRESIAKLLDFRYDDFLSNVRDEKYGDHLILAAFHFLDIRPLYEASLRIREAMLQADPPIDKFLDDNCSEPDIVQCGKLAIVRSILLAESESSLFIDPGNATNELNFQAVEKTWYQGFFELLTENCETQPDLERRFSQVAVVCFNYDRCIQHFLLNALVKYYRLDRASAATVLENLEFHHPYGVVGSLPWEVSPNQGVEFGETFPPFPVYKPDSIPSEFVKKLVKLTEQIKTFSEGSSAEGGFDRVRELLGTADRLAFLGFAFHRQNVKLLFPPSGKGATRSCKVLATGFGISDSESRSISDISDELARLGGFERSSINIALGVKCSELFDEYGKSLSFN